MRGAACAFFGLAAAVGCSSPRASSAPEATSPTAHDPGQRFADTASGSEDAAAPTDQGRAPEPRADGGAQDDRVSTSSEGAPGLPPPPAPSADCLDAMHAMSNVRCATATDCVGSAKRRLSKVCRDVGWSDPTCEMRGPPVPGGKHGVPRFCSVHRR